MDTKKDAASGLEYVAVGATENPKHIMVMLHGSGGSYEDMAMMAKFFVKKMPDTVILVPNGEFNFAKMLPPEQQKAIEASGMDTEKMRSWFDSVNTAGMTEGQAMRAMVGKLRETSEKLNSFIENQMAEYKLTESDTAVYGFSQGGVLAIMAGVERFSNFAAVVSHSGYVVDADVFSKPRMMLIVGSQELGEGLPMNGMHPETLEFLKEGGVPVTEYVAPGLAHSLNMDTINKTSAFINAAFKGPKPEAVADLSATFSKFAGAEVPVHASFVETPAGRKYGHVDVLDRNSALMQEFRKAATEAGFRDIRIVTPTSREEPDVADRLTAKIEEDAKGKFRLGGFRIG